MGQTKGYDWKITAWKFVKQLIFVLIAGLASVYGGNPIYLSIVPILNALENWIKHRND